MAAAITVHRNVPTKSITNRAVSFILWALAGFLGAFGIASLPSIGWIVLGCAGVVVGVSAFVARGRGLPGVLLGAGAVALMLASIHWGDQSMLNPTLFLIVGVALSVTGIGLEFLVELVRNKRRYQAHLV